MFIIGYSGMWNYNYNFLRTKDKTEKMKNIKEKLSKIVKNKMVTKGLLLLILVLIIAIVIRTFSIMTKKK